MWSCDSWVCFKMLETNGTLAFRGYKAWSSHFSLIPGTFPMSFCPGSVMMMIEYMQGSSILHARLIWCSLNSRADAPFCLMSHLHTFGSSIFPLGWKKKKLARWWRYKITAFACLNPCSYPLTVLCKQAFNVSIILFYNRAWCHRTTVVGFVFFFFFGYLKYDDPQYINLSFSPCSLSLFLTQPGRTSSCVLVLVPHRRGVQLIADRPSQALPALHWASMRRGTG